MTQILSVLTNWINKVFPERTDYVLIKNLSTMDVEKFLLPTIHEGFVSLTSFKEPIIKALVHEAKFHQNEQAWYLLGHILNLYLKHQPSQTIIVPIPLSKQRQKNRGYNQTTEIVKAALSNLNNVTLLTNRLYRIKDTKPQTSLAKKDRHQNVKNVFDFNQTDRQDLQNKNIIIFDDVATTGSTLKAARAAFSKSKIKNITCLVIAH